MSIMYCEGCGSMVDTDWNTDHFDEDGKCLGDEACNGHSVSVDQDGEDR